MKKPFGVGHGFKSHCISIHERINTFQGCLQSIKNNQKKIFPPFRNELLSPSKNIMLKGHPILYPLKHTYVCDYNHRCLVSSGLMFYDIIINMIRNKVLECHEEEVGCFFTNIEKMIHLYRG